MLTNKTIELIYKSLELSITNSIFKESREEYKKAKEEFSEYICVLEDLLELED